MYFSLSISMYQGTEIAFKNALYLGFFQFAKTLNLRALLTRSENTVLCVVTMIPNTHVNDHFV